MRTGRAGDLGRRTCWLPDDAVLPPAFPLASIGAKNGSRSDKAPGCRVGRRFGLIGMQRIRRLARKFGLGRSICVLLLFALIGLRIWNPPPLEELRLRTFDTYQKLAPRPPMPDSPVVILDIDAQSLSAFRQWPSPRTLVADLVTRLTNLGAAAAAFDIIFAEPDRLSTNLVAGALADLDDETREKLRRLPSNDQVLAAAMRQSRVVVGQSVVHVPDPQTQARPPTARLAMMGADPSPFIWTGPGLVQNG